MRLILKCAAGLVMALVVAAGWTLYRRHEAPRPPTAAAAPIPVVTALVTQQSVPIILTGVGTVRALNTATIRSQVAGTLLTVNFIEGQAVKRGDVLAQVDPRLYQARFDQAQAQLTRDQAQLVNTQTNLGRNVPLLKGGFATDQQVTDLRAAVSELESTIAADQANLEAARTELDYATQRAPFDGVTGIRLIDIGNLIQPAEQKGIVVLTQVQPISVVFTLPASEIPQVQAALSRGPVAVTAYDQSGQNKLDEGTLLLVDNQAEPQSGTVQLKANFPNLRRQLWPGTFVNVETTVSTITDALTVPTNALQQNDVEQFVFVVDHDGKVEARPITVIQRMRGFAVVRGGLSAGETVVTQGQNRLVPGATVRSAPPDQVLNDTPTAAGLLP